MKAFLLIVLAMILIVPSATASEPITYTDVDHLLYQFQFQGNYTEIRWSFGDGATSSEITPVHQYAEHGNYTVRCSATINGVNVSGILYLDARAPVIDTEGGTLNVGEISVPGGLLTVSCFCMLMLVQSDNHPANDMLGRKGKGLMTLAYFSGLVIGVLLVVNSMYPGGI